MRTSPGFVTRGTTWVLQLAVVAVAAAISAACSSGQAVLTQQVEAERLAAALHVDVAKGNEATNRAVLADTDEASADAAREASASMKSAAESLARLSPLLTSLGYAAERQTADDFTTRFAELQTLDAEILPLSTENTNLKAQRLAFGEAQDAVDTTAKALRTVVPSSGVGEASVLVERIIGALRQIQVLQARHIAESDESSMTGMEARMHDAEGVALRAMTRLRHLVGTATDPRQADGGPLMQAEQAIERFLSVNQEIVDLSRRNTNVRSLALTLGRRRVVAAECEDLLRALQTALEGHKYRATR